MTGLLSDEAKAAREQFVSGLTGTTVHEVAVVSSFVAFAWVICMWVVDLTRRSFPQQWAKFSFALNYFIVIVPEILVQVGYVKPHGAALVLGVLAGVAGTVSCKRVRQDHDQRYNVDFHQARKRFVSTYRGAVLVITSIAILGVDFPSFPRRFGKTETFGTGLMDIGVGSFVFMNGLVCKQYSSRRAGSSVEQSFTQRNRSILILIVLGGCRLVTTKAINYQEHASEYGVHWNFFFTQAAVMLLPRFLPVQFSTLVGAGLTIICLYQAVLCYPSVTNFVHSNQRGNDLFSMNKEGLMSLCGYTGLFIFAVATSKLVTAWFPHTSGPQEHGNKKLNRGRLWLATLKLALLSTLWWLVYLLAATFVQPVSRRACNASYVAWVMAHNILMLALLSTAHLVCPAAAPGVLDAMNHAMLPLFLLANVLTGVVNLSMDTLAASNGTAVLIVCVYMMILAAAAWWLMHSSDMCGPGLRHNAGPATCDKTGTKSQ